MKIVLRYYKGKRVWHRVFGCGTVLRCSDKTVDVKFDSLLTFRTIRKNAGVLASA